MGEIIHPYSILTGDTRVEFVIYCVLTILQLSLYPSLCNLVRIEIQLRFQKHIDPLLGYESNKVAFFQQDELSTKKKKIGASAAQNERDLSPIWHSIYIRTGSSQSLMSALNDWFNGHFWQSNMYRTFDCCQERKQETGKIQMYLLTTAKSVKFIMNL